MTTPFRQGLKKVYLPNIIFKMVRAPNLQPNQVAFRVPPSCNKFDIHSYLTNLYGANVQEVRTINYPTVHKRSRAGSMEVVQSAYKKAIVTIDEPFEWPKDPEWCALDVEEMEISKLSAKGKLKGWRVRPKETVRQQKKDLYERRVALAEEESKKK